MGLTEREQKLLEELERSLAEGQGGDPSRKLGALEFSARKIIIGILILLAGLTGLLVGVSNRSMLIGVAGFGVMLLGIFLAASTKTKK
jgi:hypothetical protein